MSASSTSLLSSSSDFSSSSVDTNESIYCNEANVSNLGEPQNSYGYFGDNVCFGDVKITGKWIINWESGAEPVIVEFTNDGTVIPYDSNGNADYNRSSIYWVSEDGMSLTYRYLFDADTSPNVFYHDYVERSETYPNWIKTMLVIYNSAYGSSSKFERWICRINDEGISSCY